MAGEAADHAAIMRAAASSLAFQQQGGRRNGGSIGHRSAEMKRQHLLRKLVRASLAIGAILFAASVTGVVIGGISMAALAPAPP